MFCKLKKSTLHHASRSNTMVKKKTEERIFIFGSTDWIEFNRISMQNNNPKFMGHNKLKVLWIDVNFGKMVKWFPVNELQTTVQTHNLFFLFPHFSFAFCFGSHCLPLYLFVYFSFIGSADKQIIHNVWI